MLSMLLINLLVGLLLRDRAHLSYVGFLGASIGFFSLFSGTAGSFLFPTVTATAQYRPMTALLALTSLAGMEFGRRFLDTPRRAPRWDRVMRGFLGLSAAVCGVAIVGPDSLATLAAALLGLLVPLVAIPAGIAALRSGSPWARFYLVGWSVFTVGGFLFAFPIPLFQVDAFQLFQLSSLLEATAFAVALADRLRILRGERVLAERALAESEQRMQSIFDNTIDATWLLDGAARVVEINRTARSSWPADPARGVELPDLLPWSGSPEASALLRRALSDGQPARFEAAFGERWADVSIKRIASGLTLVGSSRVDLQACKLEYSIVSPK